MKDKMYIVIDDQKGILLNITGPQKNLLIFQTNSSVGNYWHSFEYVPIVTEVFKESYKQMYSGINLQFYESKNGNLLEFWKEKPHVFSSWKLERFIKCHNTLKI